MPYKVVFKHIITNPDFVQLLVGKAVKIIKAYIQALRDAGANILVICEHDIQMIPPQYVEEFSLKYIKSILNIYDYNILHICGNITNHLKIIADRLKKVKALNTLSIGPYVDITNTQDLLDNKIGVAGNIDHIKLLPTGTPKQVETAVHVAIKASRGNPRFMIAPGCEITTDTPVENVKAFVHAAQTYRG
jgi:uroporphyrinogen decarboxylase